MILWWKRTITEFVMNRFARSPFARSLFLAGALAAVGLAAGVGQAQVVVGRTKGPVQKKTETLPVQTKSGQAANPAVQGTTVIGTSMKISQFEAVPLGDRIILKGKVTYPSVTEKNDAIGSYTIFRWTGVDWDPIPIKVASISMRPNTETRLPDVPAEPGKKYKLRVKTYTIGTVGSNIEVNQEVTAPVKEFVAQFHTKGKAIWVFSYARNSNTDDHIAKAAKDHAKNLASFGFVVTTQTVHDQLKGRFQHHIYVRADNFLEQTFKTKEERDAFRRNPAAVLGIHQDAVFNIAGQLAWKVDSRWVRP
jgi:hypothetical protein